MAEMNRQTTESAAVRMAVLGCGNWAHRTHIPYLLSRKDVSVVAICDMSDAVLARAAQAGTLSTAQVFTDPNEMFRESGLDAVVISTPHSSHFRYVKRALECNLHVLVDKPLACTFLQARILVELAERRDRALQVVTQRRFSDGYVYLRQAIASGALGRIRLVDCVLVQEIKPDFRGSWRSVPAENCGGITADSGYHIVDVVEWICGLKPVRVRASMNSAGHGADDVAAVTVEFEHGALATFSIFRGAPLAFGKEDVYVYGQNGMLHFSAEKVSGIRRSQLLHLDGNGVVTSCTSDLRPANGWEPMAEFLTAIQQNGTLSCSGRSNLTTVETITLAYASARQDGKWLAFSHP